MISEAKKKRANDKMQQLAKEILRQAEIRDKAQKEIVELECAIRKLGESICSKHHIRVHEYLDAASGDLVEEYKCGKCGKLFEKEDYVRWCVDSLRE
jgi:hypothetical protein